MIGSINDPILTPQMIPTDKKAILSIITCPITRQIFVEPICSLDGVFYEKKALQFLMDKFDDGVERPNINPLSYLFSLVNGKGIFCSKNQFYEQVITEISDLMIGFVLLFLVEYPSHSKDLFDFNKLKNSFNVNFEAKMKDNPRYTSIFITTEDSLNNRLANSFCDHRNFNIKSLMINPNEDSNDMGDSSMGLILMNANPCQLKYLIENITFDKGDDDFIVRFVEEFISFVAKRTIGYPSFADPMASTFPPCNDRSHCEEIIKYLFERNPSFRTLVFNDDHFQSLQGKAYSWEVLHCLFKCGFRFGSKSSIGLFTTPQRISYISISRVIDYISIEGNELVIIDAIIRNDLTPDEKIKLIVLIRAAGMLARDKS